MVGSGGGGTASEGAMAKAEEALLAGKAVALFAPLGVSPRAVETRPKSLCSLKPFNARQRASTSCGGLRGVLSLSQNERPFRKEASALPSRLRRSSWNLALL